MEQWQSPRRVGWWMTGAVLSAALKGSTDVGPGGDGAPVPVREEPRKGVRVERLVLSDAQVAEVMRVLSGGEVLAGELARQRATTREAREYAARMVCEHGTLLQRLEALLLQLGLTPEPSSLSQRLEEETRQRLAVLRPLQGEHFDLGYLDSQVAMHARAAFLEDCLLTPQVQDAQLAEELRAVRSAVQVHLQDAAALQARLTGLA